MIPLKDENPTEKTPIVTYVLLIANTLIFIYWLSQGGGRGPVMGFAMVPREIVTGQDISPFPSPSPVWITIFTSMFLHGGFLHLAGNMLYLWIFGNNIEDALGHFRFLLFYLLAGVGAAFAHIMSAPFSAVPTVGASGAIAGIMGAYLVLYPNARIITLIILGIFITTAAIPAIIIIGYWFLIQLISAGAFPATGGGVAYWAHIGGFIAGVVLIFFFGGRRLSRRQRPRYMDYWR